MLIFENMICKILKQTKISIKLFLIMIASGAYASNYTGMPNDIPNDLAKNLKSYQLIDVFMNDGVVRVVINKSIVKMDFIYNLRITYCNPVWNNGKSAWDGKDLKRIELVNSVNAQGIAFAGGKSECMKYGIFPNDENQIIIKKNAWICVAGNPCRERRPGERTAADD